VTPDTDAIVRAIARFGLPPRIGGDPSVTGTGVAERILDDPLSATDWDAVVRDVSRLKLLGFLRAAVDLGAVAATDEQAAQVVDRHVEHWVSVLYLEQDLLRVVDALDRAGIESVVLKGAAHARLLYPQPAWRMFGDNDLLLRGQDFADATRILADIGYRRPVPSARPDFDARFGKGATLLGAEGDELDLHRTLLFGTFGFRIDIHRLFDTAVEFDVEGRRLRALGPETRILHLCYHAGLGDPVPQLAGVRDLAQALALAEHDDDEVLRLARDWKAVAVLARGIELCRTHLGIEVEGPLADAARAHRLTRRERRAIASYVGVNRRHADKVLASIPFLDGPGAKLAFLRAAAAPDRAMLRAQGVPTHGAWLRRGARALTGRRPPRPPTGRVPPPGP
jgi:hypothetical protein